MSEPGFDGLLDFAAVQFTVRDLLDKGEITEAEAWWYRKGWIPATHGDGV